MVSESVAPIQEVLATLSEAYGEQSLEPLDNWFEWVLWENVAYLVDDDRRRATWHHLKTMVGADPRAILALEPPALAAIIADGGMLAETRVEKVRRCADVVLVGLDGDVDTFMALTPAARRSLLAKFPSLGKPGVAKVLLFSGSEPVATLDSNGLRVLVRLGLAREQKTYDLTYRHGIDALAPLPAEFVALRQAYLLLRRHGQEICRRTRPACEECPLLPMCPRIGV